LRYFYKVTCGEDGNPLQYLKDILCVVREIVFNQEKLQAVTGYADNQLTKGKSNFSSGEKGQNYRQDRKSKGGGRDADL
jgi:hypothetical protein